MWPFRSNIPKIKDVKVENDGDTITIIHSKGANKFQKEDVLNAEFKSDSFSESGTDYKFFNVWLFVILLFGFLNLNIVLLWKFELLPNPWFDSHEIIFITCFLLIFLGFSVLETILTWKSLIRLIVLYRIKSGNTDYVHDILYISLNDSNYRFRFGQDTLKTFSSCFLQIFLDKVQYQDIFEGFTWWKKEHKWNISDVGFPYFKFNQVTLTYILVAFCLLYLNAYTPFWFYQVAEKLPYTIVIGDNKIVDYPITNLFSNKYPFNWSGYCQNYESVNLFRAFFDGVISGILLPLGVIISLSSIILLFTTQGIQWIVGIVLGFFFVVYILIWPVSLLFFYYGFMNFNNKNEKWLSLRIKSISTIVVGIVLLCSLGFISVELGKQDDISFKQAIVIVYISLGSIIFSYLYFFKRSFLTNGRDFWFGD